MLDDLSQSEASTPSRFIHSVDAEVLERVEREEREQFRLVRIQSFNWGTFSDLLSVDVSPKGMLFIGPSGSGKSTIFDSHASLLTPPRWVHFNVAARDSESKQDRNVVTYVRGVWGEQTGAAGEVADQQLRRGTTWSAIAETYRNAEGKVVTLAHVYWIRGTSSVSRDVGKRYLVAERALDLAELKFFPESNFNVRRFKADLPGVWEDDSFSDYQERFRSRLGIDSEHALKLLHKTQSAKNLGGLTEFLRDFMLDEPKTRQMADDLVVQFAKLDSAYNEVVSAGQQIATLKPAREANAERQQLLLRRNEIQEIRAGVDSFQEERRGELLAAARQAASTLLTGQQALLKMREDARRDAKNELEGLELQRRGMGGEQLEALEAAQRQAEQEAQERETKRDKARQACVVLGVTLPDNPHKHAELVGWARSELEAAADGGSGDNEQRGKLAVEEAGLLTKQGEAQTALATLARLPGSNIPHHLVDLRYRIATALRVAEHDLPFAGELIEVKEAEKGWQGAVERVLRGTALSMLVDETLHPQVSRHVDATDLRGRLVYIRTLPQSAPPAAPKSNSLVNKVSVSEGPFRQWLHAELRQRFDIECVETSEDLRSVTNGVTRNGLTKQGGRRHEKDDRPDVNNRRNWVLGADTKAKAVQLQDELALLDERLGKVREQVKKLDERSRDRHFRVRAFQTLVDQAWNDIDVATVADRARQFARQAQDLRDATPDLAKQDERIATSQLQFDAADRALTQQGSEVLNTERQLKNLDDQIAKRAEFPSVAPTPLQRAGLEERLSATGRSVTLSNLADEMKLLDRRLGTELHGIDGELANLVRKIEDAFAAYNRGWLVESGGLDPKMASYDEYDAKLTRLEVDDLPRVEANFKQLLNEQSNQHIALLANQIDQERRDIGDKMDAVNRSLRTAEYNPGTYLVIEDEDRTPAEAKQFKADLRNALANTMSLDDVQAKTRFQALKALINRLSSQQTADVNWRTLALDVRLHVEFKAREFREDGTEVEVYRSGAGKSGGQRQKLTATCLAAALRYQLGGPGRLRPTFSTVFLDEAFDKADADFTDAAMKIFKAFGFQLIIATPIKSVMTIEPYVGGAVFVHIADRKYSRVLTLPYDEEAQRIDFAPLGVQGALDEVA